MLRNWSHDVQNTSKRLAFASFLKLCDPLPKLRTRVRFSSPAPIINELLRIDWHNLMSNHRGVNNSDHFFDVNRPWTAQFHFAHLDRRAFMYVFAENSTASVLSIRSWDHNYRALSWTVAPTFTDLVTDILANLDISKRAIVRWETYKTIGPKDREQRPHLQNATKAKND